jgi:hypothetical protein
MKNTFLVGVAAAALLAGINVASAQGTMERQPAAGGSPPAAEMNKGGAEQKGKAAVEQKGKAGAEIKSEKPATNAQAPAGNAQAQDKMKADTKADTSAKPDKAKAQDAQKQDGKAQDDKAKNAQSKPGDAKSGTSAQGDSKATTGQGSAGGAKASLTVEQKTKIRETVIKSSNAPRVTNVNFTVNVGTVIPRTVKFAPLPTILVEYNPSWRGYDYFIVGDQIVIVDPRTLRIVAVLDV